MGSEQLNNFESGESALSIYRVGSSLDINDNHDLVSVTKNILNPAKRKEQLKVVMDNVRDLFNDTASKEGIIFENDKQQGSVRVDVQLTTVYIPGEEAVTVTTDSFFEMINNWFNQAEQ